MGSTNATVKNVNRAFQGYNGDLIKGQPGSIFPVEDREDNRGLFNLNKFQVNSTVPVID